MVILDRGEEKKVSPLQGLDSQDLVKLLIRVLEEKGILTTADLEEALKRKP